MLPITVVLGHKEQEIFAVDSRGGEKILPLKISYEEQTSLEFCVLEGHNRTWYRLYDMDGLKNIDIQFTYNGSLNVSDSDNRLTQIDDLYEYFEGLFERKKYWEILGIKEGSDKYDKAHESKTSQIFPNEEDKFLAIINGAHQKIKETYEIFGFADVVLDISSLDIYLDGECKGKIPCIIGAPSGEHTITVKQGTNDISSQTIRFSPREREKVSIPLSIPESRIQYKTRTEYKTDNISGNTLALLTLLGIASSPFAMEGMEGFFLFSFFFIGFIGVFYKKKWGSILAMLSGLIAFISSNPPIMFLLGIIVIYLGWREYSALKTS